MKSWLLVLSGLVICLGFMVFFTAFLMVPFLLLGVFVMVVMWRDRHRSKGEHIPRSAKARREAIEAKQTGGQQS